MSDILGSADIVGRDDANSSWASGFAVLDSCGHSYAYGQGATNEAYGVIDNLAPAIGARQRRNRGIGGALACWHSSGTGAPGDGGYAWVLQQYTRSASVAPYLPRHLLTIPWYGINDLAYLGSTKPRPYQEAMRTIMSRLCASSVDEAGGAAVTMTGTWTTNTTTLSNSGADYRSTVTVNDQASWAIPADFPGNLVAALGLVVAPADDYVMSVTIDGVAYPDVAIQGAAICDSANSKNNGVVLRYTLASSGAHTIVAKLKTYTAGSMKIDYGQIEADPLDGPILLVPNIMRTPAYTLWNAATHGPSAGTDPMNDAGVATFNAALASVLGEFPGRTLFSNLDTSIAKNTIYFSGDNAHPNDLGHSKMAEVLRDTLVTSKLLTSRTLTRGAPQQETFWRLIGDPGQPAFQNSWVNTAPVVDEMTGFRRDLDGRVYIKGNVKSGSAANAVIFTLPASMRPLKARAFAVVTGAAVGVLAVCLIASNGNVSFSSGGNTANGTSLDEISFQAGV